MKQVEVVARSQEQAIQWAAEELGVDAGDLHVIEEYEPDELDIETLSKREEEAGFTEEHAKGEPVLYMVQVSARKVVEPVQEWLSEMMELFQPGAACEVSLEGSGLRAELDCDEPSILIGKNGQTLAAFQHIVTRVVHRVTDSDISITVDVGDYVDRRHERLEKVARSAAERVIQRKRSVRLQPMSAADRKFVHNLLKNTRGIETTSFGREPRRYVTIFLEGATPREDDAARFDEEGGGRRGRRGQGGNKGRQGGKRREGGGRERGTQRRGRRDDGFDDRAFGKETRGEAKDIYGKFKDAPPESYEDVALEESRSRLPRFDEKAVDEKLLEEDRPFVDELE